MEIHASVASPALELITKPSLKVPWSTVAASLVRQALCTLTTQNPLLWSWWKGSQNPQADMEGPYYLFGAPNRQFQDGKAVIATAVELQEFKPYLLKISVRGPGGERVKHATFDWWQANTSGIYFFGLYDLRGKFQTDENGDVEVLTVVPGKYGPESHKRAGHFHFILTDSSGKYQPLTSQLYVCRANDSAEMGTDFLNFVRKSRPVNMLNSWSTTDEQLMELPPLPHDELAMRERLDWWNARIGEWKAGASILAGAEVEIRLSV